MKQAWGNQWFEMAEKSFKTALDWKLFTVGTFQ